MNAPRRPPPGRPGPPDDPNAELVARLFEVLDAFEDACRAHVILAQTALSSLWHTHPGEVNELGEFHDGPKIFADDGESSGVTPPETGAP